MQKVPANTATITPHNHRDQISKVRERTAIAAIGSAFLDLGGSSSVAGSRTFTV